MSVKSTTAAATATTIITIPGTGWRTIALSNRALYCWKAATCMTRRVGKRVRGRMLSPAYPTGGDMVRLGRRQADHHADGDAAHPDDLHTGQLHAAGQIETETAELAKAVRRTLAEKFQQEANVIFPPELVALVDSLEAELQRGELSETNRAWLAQCGLTPEQIQNQMEPVYTPQRKIHLYHCDHRGLPLALINSEGKTDWSVEYDAWGNVLSENNPHNLKQLIRLPGQQYDEETGLYYNRYRYYDPVQGRYITQDPIGLIGGWNGYAYPLNPSNTLIH